MRSIIFLMLLIFSAACGHKKSGDDPMSPVPGPDKNPAEATLDSSGPYPVIKMSNGKTYHTGLLHKQTEDQALLKGMGGTYVRFTDCGELPAEFDLRTLNLVSDVKDQGNCGSCWAFSKTNSLESAMLGEGKKLNLSEQELVSCDRNQYGCGGGFMSDFDYQISHGQSLESDFPYTASDARCKAGLPIAAKGVSFQYVGAANRGPTTSELQCALFKFRTVPWITVGATNAWGSPPASELTPYTRCGAASTNHAVGVVGWHTIAGKVQFIMKNSWSVDWGDKGYMSLPLGCNNFGEEVGFIEVEKAPVPPGPTPTPTPPGPEPTPTPGPGPCVPAKVKLPAEVQVFGGNEIMLGVKSEAGVSYSWMVDGVLIPGANESMLYVTPPKDAVYKLTGRNACSVSESQSRVRIVMSMRP